jgi:hypothetical protein
MEYRPVLGLVALLFVLLLIYSASTSAVFPVSPKPPSRAPETQEVYLNLRDPDTDPVAYLAISKLVIGTDHGAYLVLNRSSYDPLFFNLTMLLNRSTTVVRARLMRGNITYLIICIPEVRVQHQGRNHSVYRTKISVDRSVCKSVYTQVNVTNFVSNWTHYHEKDYEKVINASREYIARKGGFGAFMQLRNRTRCLPEVPCMPEDLPIRYPECFVIALNGSIPVAIRPIPSPVQITIVVHVDINKTLETLTEAPVNITIERG